MSLQRPLLQLHCADGSTIEYDEVIWCTQGGAQPWLRETGLELDGHGFIAVHPTLEPGSWWTVPSTLSDDGAPSARLVAPKAELVHSPEQRRGLRRASTARLRPAQS